MPNAFRHLRDLNGVLESVQTSAAGPGAYNGGAQPTMVLPCKEIVDYGQVRMWSDSGYIPVPVALTTPHTVRYSVMTINRNAAVGAIIATNHAVHAHDLLVKQNGAAAKVMNITNIAYESNSGGDVTIAGDGANGGIISTVQTHLTAAAAMQNIPGLEEVLNGTNLAGVTFYAQAFARVR